MSQRHLRNSCLFFSQSHNPFGNNGILCKRRGKYQWTVGWSATVFEKRSSSIKCIFLHKTCIMFSYIFTINPRYKEKNISSCHRGRQWVQCTKCRHKIIMVALSVSQTSYTMRETIKPTQKYVKQWIFEFFIAILWNSNTDLYSIYIAFNYL